MQKTFFENGEGSVLTHPHSTEIISILDEQARGWNEGNAEMYSKAFSEEGSFTNIFGMFFTGYSNFLQKHNMILNGVFKDSVFEYRLINLRFINNDVAIAETLLIISGLKKSGPFNMIYTDTDGRLFTRLIQVMVKKNNDWKIVSYHNIDIKEGIAIPELI